MIKKKYYSSLSWEKLTSEQKQDRKLSLKVLTEMKRGKHLTKVAEEYGITPYKVKKHLGRYIHKKKGKWIPSKKDRIERSMLIYERGRQKTITLSSSQDASFIGAYFNAVKKALEKGDKSVLKPFKKITIIDSNGKRHKLETNLQKLYDISEQQEDSEVYEIYDVED